MLRSAIMFAICALMAGPAYAQKSKERVYAPAPAGLAAPNGSSAADIRAATGNLDRWAKAERVRLGQCETIEALRLRTDQWTAEAKATKMPDKRYFAEYPKRNCPANADVEGYFLLNSSDPTALISPGAIVSARWAGGEFLALGSFSPIEGYCASDVTKAPQPSLGIDSFVYLGPKWNDEWSNVAKEFFPIPDDPARAINRDIKIVVPKDYSRQVGKAYPIRALDREKSGDATVVCKIGGSAPLPCALVTESPTGWEFGAAAMKLSALLEFDASATTASGKCAVFPLAFRVG